MDFRIGLEPLLVLVLGPPIFWMPFLVKVSYNQIVEIGLSENCQRISRFMNLESVVSLNKQYDDK